MTEGSSPADPQDFSRHVRIGNAIRRAQEDNFRKQAWELQEQRLQEAGNRRRQAAFRAVQDELIPVFLARMACAGHPGLDRKTRAWPVAVQYHTGGKAAYPQHIVALDKRGRLWQAGTFQPQAPYTDISAGRIGQLSRAEAEGLNFHPVSVASGDPDIFQFYLDEAFEASIGWYAATGQYLDKWVGDDFSRLVLRIQRLHHLR
jgi:hypothetical protein